MKNKIIYLVIVLAVVVICVFGFLFIKNFLGNTVVADIMKVDINENKTLVHKSTKLKAGEKLKLSKFDEYKDCGVKANDIKIVEVSNDYVKISRKKTFYEKNNQGSYESYTKVETEKINYNTPVSMNVDKTSPDSPDCSQARYYYYLIFKKK